MIWNARRERTPYLAWMLLVLLTAVTLRLVALATLPPGLTHDEADHGLTAWRIVGGARDVYFTIGYGREPLYDYATAVLMRFLGPTYLAGRVTAVFFSLILIAGMAAWVRRVWGWQTAVLTAAGLAVSFWPLLTARQSLRSITLPALLTLAVYLFWRGLEKHKTPANLNRQSRPVFYFAAAGMILGLTFYTYIPARLLWAIFPATLGYLAWQNRPLLRRVWRETAVMLLLAGLVGAPLFIYLATHPAAETRIGQLSAPLTAVAQGNFTPLWQNVRAGLGLFFIAGDDFWRYTISGRPLLPPLMAILFVSGFIVAAWDVVTGRRRDSLRPAATFLAISWLLAGLAPTLVTGVHLSTTQAIGMQPVVYLFPALAIYRISCSVFRERLTAYSLQLTALLFFGSMAVLTARDYFTLWANQPDVRVEYESTMVAAMNYLNTHHLAQTAVSTLTPGAVHTPAVALMTLHPTTAVPRWFDARASLLLPAGDQSTILVPGFTPMNPALMAYWATAVLSDTLPLRPTDLDRPLDVYVVDGAAMAADWAAQFTPPPEGVVNFGDAADLLGYDLPSWSAAPGDVVTVMTLWQVKRPLPDAILFTQVLGADGRPIAQADRLDAPGAGWQAGDQFIQLHQFTLPEDTAVGHYPIIVGLYTCGAGCPHETPPQRLPILNAPGQTDYLTIGELMITAP